MLPQNGDGRLAPKEHADKGVDPKTESMRGVFEMLSLYALIAGGAFLVAYGLLHALAWVPGWDGLSDAWNTAVGVVAFFAAALAANMSFDGKRGARRKAWAELQARRYAFPVVLVCGFLAGLYQGKNGDRYSEEAEARRAALAACAQLRSCTMLATRLNWGNDVRAHIGARVLVP